MVATAMKKVTYYGYFGPTTNVKDAPISAEGVNAFAAAIGALPAREKRPSNVVALPKGGAR